MLWRYVLWKKLVVHVLSRSTSYWPIPLIKRSRTSRADDNTQIRLKKDIYDPWTAIKVPLKQVLCEQIY